jgi:DNA polymerase III alpha subunit (gram-positive type)
MNYKDIIFLDFETTGKNCNTAQPIELAAVAINGRRLEINHEEKFSSLIRPIFDEAECARLGLQPVTEEVLRITNIDMEELKLAPDLKTVWSQFEQFTYKFNPKRNTWTAPIMAGFNINRYDLPIINRICGGHFWQKQIFPAEFLSKAKEAGIKIEEPYGFGPWDESYQSQKLFNKIIVLDLMEMVWTWTENSMQIESNGMGAVRDWLGIDSTGAHRALKDVEDGAEIVTRFLKLQRYFGPQVNWQGKKNG